LNPVIPDFDAPVRIARPAMPQPPEVPPSLSESLPITVRFIRRAWVEGRLAGETVATIARTDQRLHMRSSEDREWLFIRNPVDQRRVRALLVDHEAQLILGYEESDLNLEGVAADWLSAASLGIPADLVDRMARTGERAAFGELNATRFLPPSDAIEPDMPNELWWSEEDHLPVLAVYEGPGGRVELSVELVGRSVDSTLIQDSTVRYPSYAAMDLADWREERH
jgi:hypothetical protein